MKLKAAILSILGRDDLKSIIDAFYISGVDRRSTDEMRTKLSNSRKVKVDGLLQHLQKKTLISICEIINLPTVGKRDELITRLLHFGNPHYTNQVSQSDSAIFESIRFRYQLLHQVMDARSCYIWAASEAYTIGSRGLRLVSQATGISVRLIRAGLQELRKLEGGEAIPKHVNAPRVNRDDNRVRRPGAGRKSIEETYPDIVNSLQTLVENDIAGDPMGRQKKWIRRSLRELARQLKAKGYKVSTSTVSRLLKGMGFSLKKNKRRQPKSQCQERDKQFRYIASQRQLFCDQGLATISVDTKKKELIGQFRNNGKTWCLDPEEVDEHDFPDAAECKAVPLGVYDVVKNRGYVVVGICNDTPEFAVNSIKSWWKTDGSSLYQGSNRLLILGDSGGCNGCRSKSWKWHLQEMLCDECGLIVTMCHYPPGCSKWNPVEHRLFSYISINWAGRPLNSLDVMLGYIRGTTTKTGLTVEAALDECVYRRGHKPTKDEMQQLNLRPHDVCPQWNYTIHPRH